ncbi:hypothetical protein EXE58_15515 [Nocardioides seonyuensis]|uniref:Uncharacterized protein n=1 Tax=Nocardioides seonyuensis TaxID=2518371 RepID=A0A4P7IHF4_9ACTN|nr:hypothetical protein [Nocardioides seonyuensis]QBX56725.1 hypothetical protein EXE58_15515 [Nocardioides seonyuensis]
MAEPGTEPGTGQVRICLVGCSGLLGDIISDAVSRDGGIDVVASVAGPAGLADLADTGPGLADIDLVVWNCSDESQASRWLERTRPYPRILAAVEDGRHAALWELAPQRTALGLLSPRLLTEVIRRRATPAS